MRFKVEGTTNAAPTTTGTATTVESATEVSCFNNSTTAYAVAILTAASGTVVGNITLAGGERVNIVKDRIVEILLETAIFQIESMRIPHHAIVSQTVEATKLLNKKNLSAFVNGILREYLRSSKNTDCEDEEVIYNHPQWIINKTRDNWPKNFTEILKNNNLQAPMWLRVNQKKITAEKYLGKLARKINLKTEEVGYVGDLGY